MQDSSSIGVFDRDLQLVESAYVEEVVGDKLQRPLLSSASGGLAAHPGQVAEAGDAVWIGSSAIGPLVRWGDGQFQ